MTDYVGVFAGLVGAAQFWSDQSSKRYDERLIALRDLKQALRHTEMYIRNLERTHNLRDHLDVMSNRDWETERGLADIWHEASLSCRRIDKSISEMANTKSGFWEDVSRWTRSDITRYGIAVEDARTKIELLEDRLLR